MNTQFTEKKLIATYIELDDLLKSFKEYRIKTGKPLKERNTQLSDAEVGTILVMYHFSGYKCFEYYYYNIILKEYKSWFPNAPCYESFLRYTQMSLEMMVLWLLYKCAHSERTNLYIIDSKKLPVCHIKREHSNKVFEGLARKGKSSTGWFYGYKIHLVINNIGEIVSFELTTGNVADNNHDLLKRLLLKLEGICIGDKGYLSTLFDFFYENKLHLLTKQKSTTKNKLALPQHLKMLDKRCIVESVFDILGSVINIEHTRHRNPTNAFVNIYAALVAYQFYDKKPCVYFPSLVDQYTSAA